MFSREFPDIFKIVDFINISKRSYISRVSLFLILWQVFCRIAAPKKIVKTHRKSLAMVFFLWRSYRQTSACNFILKVSIAGAFYQFCQVFRESILQNTFEQLLKTCIILIVNYFVRVGCIFRFGSIKGATKL